MSFETLKSYFYTKSRPQIADLDHRADHLLVFNVNLYHHLYKEAIDKTQDPKKARDIVRTAILNDGYGLITEKISGEKDGKNYIFTDHQRASLQLTPPRHIYLEAKHTKTGEKLMVAPEHVGLNKDVLDTFTSWRRGRDKQVMTLVRDEFLKGNNKKTPLVEAPEHTYFWTSPKAEQWEDEPVKRFNGKYGYLYMGRVVEEAGVRMMIVHDFKTDLTTEAYKQFIETNSQELITKEDKQPLPPLDQLMTTIGKTKRRFSVEEVWQKLSEAKKEVTGDETIFNLSPEIINALQDASLHTHLKSSASAEVSDWLLSEIEKGTSPTLIQLQVRQKYLDATQGALRTHFQAKKDINYSDVTSYSGSSGDFCGDWGGGGSPPAGGGSMYVIGREGGMCSEIKCRSCGWKPKPEQLEKIRRREITCCPKCQTKP